MSEGVWVAIIGVVGLFITAWFGLRSLKATLKNNLDLALLQLKQGQESIANKQNDMSDKQDETNIKIDGKMTELLRATAGKSHAEGKAEGKIEGEQKGAAENQAITDAKPQDQK